MKTLFASIFALALLGAAGASNASIIGVHVGPVGVGIGVHHHHHHCGWRHHHRYCW